MQSLFSALIDWAGVERPISVEGGSPEVQYLESGADRLVFVFGPAKVSLRLPAGGYTARDLIRNAAVPLSPDGAFRVDQLSVIYLKKR